MQILFMSVRAFGRGLLRSPGFALGVIAIMMLGLGVNAVTFNLVDRLVLSGPAGVTNSDRVRRVVAHRHSPDGVSFAVNEFSYADYEVLRASGQLAGAAAESDSPMLFGAGESAERIQGRLVTAGYFPLLGVTPAAGRFFTDDESARQGLRVAVLTHAFWTRRFGADHAVLGQQVQIGDGTYTVVGVAPPRFTGTAVRKVDVFLPLEAASDEIVSGAWRTGRNIGWIQMVARLAPAATDASAEAEISAANLESRRGERNADPNERLALEPLTTIGGESSGAEVGVAALLWGVAFLVLLIAAANVANLFLARALRNADQLAVRLALGASRGRIMLEQALEGALLAFAGAIAAVGAALLATPLVQRLLFPGIDWMETSINMRGLAFVGVCAIAGGALAAGLPVIRASRMDVVSWLRAGRRTSRSRTRVQAAMLMVQGALSVVLLVGAGLFVQSLERAQAVDLGVDTGRVLVLSATAGTVPLAPAFIEDWRTRVSRLPGVESTALVSGTMPFVSSWAVGLTIPGLPERPRIEDGGPYIAAVSPGYFVTVGTSIVEGRPFTDADRDGAPRAALVNQTMAKLYWPGQSAIGKCMQVGRGAPCSTVVGIVENTRRQGISEDDSLLFYVPLEQAPENLRLGARLIARIGDGDLRTQGRVAEQARREALTLAPGLRFVSARALDDVIAPQLQAWRIGASLFSVFGALALIVAAIGFYSVVAFDVEGRKREMGVRSALGAPSSAILRLVVLDGVRLGMAGIAIGAAAAWSLAPLSRDLLYGVEPRNPAIVGGAAVVLAIAAVLASALPALRAARVDPSLALRND